MRNAIRTKTPRVALAYRGGSFGSSVNRVCRITVVLLVVAGAAINYVRKGPLMGDTSWSMIRSKLRSESSNNYRARLFGDLMHNNQSLCQQAAFMPSQIGCPSSCVGYREDSGANETFYRTSASWYFGQPEAFVGNHGFVPTAYEKGINFECPLSAVQDFVNTRDTLSSKIANKIPDLIVKHQIRIHLNLAYICCLRPEEIYWVHQAFHEWVLERHPFDIPLAEGLSLKDLQCWKIRSDVITNILAVDLASQFHLMRIYEDFMDYIYKRTNGVVRGDYVPRGLQYPFHFTLVGYSRCKREEIQHDVDNTPSCAITENDLKTMNTAIQTTMKEVSRTMQGGPWAIRHAPRIGKDPIKHTR